MSIEPPNPPVETDKDIVESCLPAEGLAFVVLMLIIVMVIAVVLR